MSRIPTDYQAARSAFRARADAIGWQRQSYPIAARGPLGEELTIDIAASPGSPEAPVLLISSGVHGVEGFFGSAVQTEALQHFAQQPLSGAIRCVMIHAVSPFGFAHRRRFDENNVDPNRNFLRPEEPFHGSPPLYRECQPVLNPPYPPSWPDGFLWHTLKSIWRYGFTPLKQAIAGGQYDYTQGIFYGGSEPSESSRILLKCLPEWFGAAQRVLHLDFHTGLGRWAEYKLLLDPVVTPQQRQAAASWFGADHLQDSIPERIAYQTRGGFGEWCVHHHASRDYLFLCAEFGTYGPVRMLRTIRRENQATHYCPAGSEKWEAARAALLDAFVPRSESWRNQVLTQAADVITRGVNGLLETTLARG